MQYYEERAQKGVILNLSNDLESFCLKRGVANAVL